MTHVGTGDLSSGDLASVTASVSEDLALVDATGDPAELLLDESIGAGLDVSRQGRKERVEGHAHGQSPFAERDTTPVQPAWM